METHVRRGVRRDGTPYVVAKHASNGKLIRLVMPNDPAFEQIDYFAVQYEAATRTKAIESPMEIV